jgi:hypothetical protein
MMWLTLLLIFVAIQTCTAAPQSVPWAGTPQALSFSSACQETCCCSVCSSRSDAFPYGLLSSPLAVQPNNPSVSGSTCHVSIWSDRQYNDSQGNPVTVPSTLFWKDYNVFLDNIDHVAPVSCSCCRFSGVNTNCKEKIPVAAPPTAYLLHGGLMQEYRAASISFTGGFQLNITDYMELRNDTLCGYVSPRPVKRYTSLSISADRQEATVNIARLPSRGCYTLCYFHSELSTPQWYNLGKVTVNAVPQSTLSYTVGGLDVLLEGTPITLTFFGKSLLSVFDDEAEIRSSGTCGSTLTLPSASTGNGTQGILSVVKEEQWCQPPVVPLITSQRPLNYIAVQYSDCPSGNRIYQSRVEWKLRLPVLGASSYKVCYRLNGTWNTLPNMAVQPQVPVATALMQLYNSTNGPHWKHSSGWTGVGAVPCQMFGVRCSVSGDVEMIVLPRNNLTGTIPQSVFYAPYFKTLEHFALNENNLVGTIPREVGVLEKLKLFNVGQNNLTGTLPSTLTNTPAYIVYVGNNVLAGEVPRSVDSLKLQWLQYGNNISDPSALPQAPGCPTDVLECSEIGSTDYGTTACGYDGISEEACLVYGCCFNAQAPLTFGGTTCFTRRRKNFLQYPPCQALSCTGKSV